VWRRAAPPGAATKERLAHVLDLAGGFERVFEERFKSRARTAVRRAERAGVRAEVDTSGRLVPVFYSLYRKSIRRWARRTRLPGWIHNRVAEARDPVEKFTAHAAALGDSCRIWVAYVGDRPAAALICLVQGPSASYWRGCIDDKLSSTTRASHLLQKLAIEDACRSGCRVYHMGETGAVASLAQFKEGFGALPYRYEEFRLTAQAPADLNGVKPTGTPT
jgi:lipid II:glycine glycyltransferase (peptidoglycan interpeptide bridge formation enzyme)